MTNRIWLTWELQRRNRTLSSKLGADLYEIVAEGSRLRRYPHQIYQTIKVIFTRKPAVLFVQNPSLLLAGICVCLGKFLNTIVIIDAHNAGIFPLEGKFSLLNKVAAVTNSLADKVIVSNSPLIKFVRKNTNDIFAIPDPTPSINNNSDYPVDKSILNLVFVCSWADDEPYDEVLRLAENISKKVHIYITGNSRGKEKRVSANLPKNVTLTGFISDSKYENLLTSCDAIMVLTKRDNCLVCGAYEGLAVEKPMILSKTDVLVNYFSKGCIYTDNTEQDIENSIVKVFSDRECLLSEIKKLRLENENRFEVALATLSRQLPN